MSDIAKIKIDVLNKKKTVKIGVLSDTHISDQEWEVPLKLQEDFKDADAIIHCGDLVSIKVVDTLKNVCPQVIAVSGNMDLTDTKNKLPSQVIVLAGKHRIGVTHGYGHPSTLIDLVSKTFHDEDVDIIVFGHSHSPVNEKRGGILYFNPGSLTDKMFARYNSYGVIEIGVTVESRIVRL